MFASTYSCPFAVVIELGCVIPLSKYVAIARAVAVPACVVIVPEEPVALLYANTPFVPGKASLPVNDTVASALVLGVNVTTEEAAPEVIVNVEFIEVNPFVNRPVVSVLFAKLTGMFACWIPDIEAVSVIVLPAVGVRVDGVIMSGFAFNV